jgi:serine O-acetyltransferase
MIFKNFRQEVDSMIARDPAARSRLEVVLVYPGFHALMFYRLSHALWRRDWRLIGRFVSQFARWVTGIEIHPGARIGRNLFIDHGMGVVIGETAVIGDNVTLYHGVTLGGIAPSIDSESQVDKKRHPTLENDVIVGSGAQVLGPITVARCARVGANAVVVRDVPEGLTVTGIPARITAPRNKKREGAFMAYGTPSGDQPDPLIGAIESLRTQVSTLTARIEELEGRKTGGATEVRTVMGGEEEGSTPEPRVISRCGG